MGHKSEKGESAKTPLPEAFLWGSPWIRIDRFKNKPWSFSIRIILGFVLGLLLGRVLGSIEGLFGQWVFDGLDRLTAGGVDSTLGRVVYWFARIIGTVLRPLLSGSPLADSLAEAQASTSGSFALLFLGQVHGTVNGLYQGLRPGLGSATCAIIEKIILPWGTLWHLCTKPVRMLLSRRILRDDIQSLLADPQQEGATKRLRHLFHSGRLPIPQESELWTAREAVQAYPGKPPPEKREALWWHGTSFRSEIYKWIEKEKELRALPLLLHGLYDPDRGARRKAVLALASLETPAALNLIDLLDDDDAEVREAAVAGLKAYGRKLGI